MKAHRELLSESLISFCIYAALIFHLVLSAFALQCIDCAVQRKSPALPVSPASPTPSDVSSLSALASTSQDSDVTVVSPYTVSHHEKTTYYNGITDDDDHPDLLHRSNLLTNAFPKPKGRHAHLPTKSVTGVYDTSVNKVWDTIGTRIRDLVKGRKVRYSSIYPGSTSPDTAHQVSQDILALLVENGIEGTVVE